MKSGYLLAVVLMAATVALIVMGTLNPPSTAVAYAGGQRVFSSSATPEEAVKNLANEIRARQWKRAYENLANNSDFTQDQFVHDLTGYYPSLRRSATLDSFDVFPLHASDDNADVRLELHWSDVVGPATSTRNLHVVRDGGEWKVQWPLVKEPVVQQSQVIYEDYLRWDVIYRGAGDDWGTQNVDSPHVSIVDMHPVQRAEGVVVLGELLNQDVVPAYVTVSATLISKDQSPLATESCFDKISHLLLPKQVTPFRINFPNQVLSNVGSIDMMPFSSVVSRDAGPVIAIDNEKINPAPDASLTGQVVNQSGKVINVAHVLGTLYDGSGNVIWVVDQYIGRALLPEDPVSFNIPIPEDLARKVASQRTVVSSFSFGGSV
jgi:hypothetical protein